MSTVWKPPKSHRPNHISLPLPPASHLRSSSAYTSCEDCRRRKVKCKPGNCNRQHRFDVPRFQRRGQSSNDTVTTDRNELDTLGNSTAFASFSYTTSRDITASIRTLARGGLKPYGMSLRSSRMSTTDLSPFSADKTGNASPLTEKNSYELPCLINGTLVSAVPDYGSPIEGISFQFATRHSIDVDQTSTREIRLPSGKWISTGGRAEVEIGFPGESQLYRRVVDVFHSVCDVVLGRSFLSETETMTRFTSRIRRYVNTGRMLRSRLFFLGDEPQEFIRCSLNNGLAAAFPDTGSEVMAVSRDYALAHNLRVSAEHRTWLEFIDGTSALTDGLVRDAELVFGEGSESFSFRCDLHVVDGLPTDVILNDDFVFGHDVFNRFAHLFYSQAIDAKQEAFYHSFLDSINFMRYKRPSFLDRISSALRDRPPPVSTHSRQTWQTRLLEELDLQDRNGEEIDRLPEPERSARSRAEQQRQKQWRLENPAPMQGIGQQSSDLERQGVLLIGSFTGSSTMSGQATGGTVGIAPPLTESFPSGHKLSATSTRESLCRGRRWTMRKLQFSRRKDQ